MSRGFLWEQSKKNGQIWSKDQHILGRQKCFFLLKGEGFLQTWKKSRSDKIYETYSFQCEPQKFETICCVRPENLQVDIVLKRYLFDQGRSMNVDDTQGK